MKITISMAALDTIPVSVSGAGVATKNLSALDMLARIRLAGRSDSKINDDVTFTLEEIEEIGIDLTRLDRAETEMRIRERDKISRGDALASASLVGKG